MLHGIFVIGSYSSTNSVVCRRLLLCTERPVCVSATFFGRLVRKNKSPAIGPVIIGNYFLQRWLDMQFLVAGVEHPCAALIN
jgi:hypothetical protein